MRLIGLFLAALIFSGLAGGHDVYAQGFSCAGPTLEQPMRPILMKAGDSRVLILAGGFEHEGSEASPRGTYGDISLALHRRNYDEIWLCSGGGSVTEGLKLGRAFQGLKARVRVPNGFSCASSCTNAILGGYARTIDRGANFIVHSSSAVKSIELASTLRFGCSRDRHYSGNARPEDCATIVDHLIKHETTACTHPDQLNKDLPCLFIYFGRPESPQAVLVRLKALVLLPPEPQFVAAIANSSLRRKVGYTADLIQYYQEMLTDGKRGAVKSSAYRNVVNNHRWPHPHDPDRGSRDLGIDVAELLVSGSRVNTTLLWQELLTEIEVDLQRAMIALLRTHEAQLGLGAREALNILEATITCRIQSTCYLDRNAVAQLGYHNFDPD